METLILSAMSADDLSAFIEAAVRKALSGHASEDKSAKHDAAKPMTVSEAARYLDLKPATVYGLVHKRQIPNLKRGGRLYFLQTDLDTWLAQGRRLTDEELSEVARAVVSKRKSKKF